MNELVIKSILKRVYETASQAYEGRLDAVVLFGSYARGDYDDESDIDVMVIVDMDDDQLIENKNEIVELMSDITMEYGVMLSIILQSKEKLNTYKEILPFYQNVLKEGVVYVA